MSKIPKFAHIFINRLNSRIEATFRNVSLFRSTKTRYNRENVGVTNPPSEATLGIQNRTLFTCKKKIGSKQRHNPRKKSQIFGKKSWESCTRFKRISRWNFWGHPKGTIFEHKFPPGGQIIAFCHKIRAFPPIPGKTYFLAHFRHPFSQNPKKLAKSGIFGSHRQKTAKIVKISLFRQKPTL